MLFYYINFDFLTQFWFFFHNFFHIFNKKTKIWKSALVTLATSWDPLPLYFKSQSIKENGDLNSSTKLGQRRRLLCSCFLLSRTVLSLPTYEPVDWQHFPSKIKSLIPGMILNVLLGIGSYSFTILTYFSHFNSHFLLSRSGISFLKTSHISKKNSHSYLIRSGNLSGNCR